MWRATILSLFCFGAGCTLLTGAFHAVCGDGFLNNEEECDDGSTADNDGCSRLCRDEVCGDGIQQISEECDDGALNSDSAPDACRTGCTNALCGDGVVDSTELCDDTNTISNDGCEANCQPSAVIAVDAGASHTCALLRSGDVRCFGDSSGGALGYGDFVDVGDNEPPSDIAPANIGGIVTKISAGSSFSCAILDTGNARCWGTNGNGQLGYANTINIGGLEDPAVAGDITLGDTVTQISTGEFHTCALLTTGNVRCWGLGNFGALGYGNTDPIGDNEDPNSVGTVNVGKPVTQIEAGGFFTCALLDTGDVRCWGSNLFGQLGYGNTDQIGDNETPNSAGNVDVGELVTQITAGSSHSCALLDTGNVRCWGANGGGQLGYANTNIIGDDETPSSVGAVEVGGAAVQISVGNIHTCALLDTGRVRCWGRGLNGRLGYGNENNIGDAETPASVGDVSLFESSL